MQLNMYIDVKTTLNPVDKKYFTVGSPNFKIVQVLQL